MTAIRTTALLVSICAALLSVAQASASSYGNTGSVKVTRCQAAVTTGGRSLTVGTKMSTADQQLKMHVSYAVLERDSGHSSWTDVTPQKLIDGFSEGPGVSVFKHSEKVSGLTAPARYKVVATMTWLQGSTEVQRKVATSGTCKLHPKRLQPDLLASDMKIGVGTEATSYTYTFVVTNIGSKAASNFGVSLTVDGKEAAVKTIMSLPPNGSVKIKAVRPSCTSGFVLGDVDTSNTVAEYNESNNSTFYICPVVQH